MIFTKKQMKTDHMSIVDGIKGVDPVDWKNVGIIKNALENVSLAIDADRAFFSEYADMKKAMENAYSLIGSDEDVSDRPEILRSHFCATATESFVQGMRFPKFDVSAKDWSAPEKRELASIAKGVLDWAIRSSGFGAVYHDSKFYQVAFGDSFRRPFLRKSKGKKGKEKVKLQYEDLDPSRVILDPNMTELHSETVSRSASFWGYTTRYDKKSLVRKFGKEVLKHVMPGGFTGHASFFSGEPGGTDYYEVLEYQDCSDMVELILVGGNAFPVHIRADGFDFKKEISKELRKDGVEKVVSWKSEYGHYNSFGEPIITLHGSHMYKNLFSARNYGIVHKLSRAQKGHEEAMNLSFDGSRRAMRKIVFLLGGRADVLEEKMSQLRSDQRNSLDSYIQIPASTSAATPTIKEIDFAGEGRVSDDSAIERMFSLARNATGIEVDRLQVHQNIGLGQSELIEGEKTASVEYVIDSNISALTYEYVGLLLFIINHKGFGSKERISFSRFVSTKGEDGVVDVRERPGGSMTVEAAAKKLVDFDFDLNIDQNSIVKHDQIASTEKLIKYLGTIDLAALPKVGKAIMKRVADVMKIDIPEEDFEGIENSRAQGGISQFQAGEVDPEQVSQEAIGEEGVDVQ